MGGRTKPENFPLPVPQIQSASQTDSLPFLRLQPLQDVCAMVPTSSRRPSPGLCQPHSPPFVLPAFLLWVSSQASTWFPKFFLLVCYQSPVYINSLSLKNGVVSFPSLFFFPSDWTFADPGGNDYAFALQKQRVLRNIAGWARAGFKDAILSWLCWKK